MRLWYAPLRRGGGMRFFAVGVLAVFAGVCYAQSRVDFEMMT